MKLENALEDSNITANLKKSNCFMLYVQLNLDLCSTKEITMAATYERIYAYSVL